MSIYRDKDTSRLVFEFSRRINGERFRRRRVLPAGWTQSLGGTSIKLSLVTAPSGSPS